MLSVAEALAIVLGKTGPLAAVTEELRSAKIGRVLAEDVCSDLDSPPFTKSLRDGYAVRLVDVPVGGATLQVAGESPAGATFDALLREGEAVRIFTGAPLPLNADAVAMQEDCVREGGHVRIPGGLKSGLHILPQGAEHRSGDVVLSAGATLGPQELGLLASLGRVSASIHLKPRVAVLSSGSEIVETTVTPVGAQIRNSNGPMLLAQALRAGAEPVSLGIVKDDKRELADRVRIGITTADITVVSGGVSVGDYDHLPHIVKNLGVETHFHYVSMKPGKPVLFGSHQGKLLFGLPGNPVSAFVCFELFVRPAIDRMLGNRLTALPWIDLPLDGGLSTTNDRPTLFPANLVVVNATLRVRPIAGMNSANLHSLTGADALIGVSAGTVQLTAGENVSTLRLVR